MSYKFSEFIPLHEPIFFGNEKKYLLDCINSGWVSSEGSYVKEFEKRAAAFLSIPYSCAVMNGTSAIHLSLLAVGVKPGDEVITPTLTFIAPVNAIHYVGARPIFMDCDDHLNLNEDKTIDFLENMTFTQIKKRQGRTISETYNKETKAKISAIIIVHVLGNAAGFEKLSKLAKSKGIKVIEDASESLGTAYKKMFKNKFTGTVSDIGCFSFNGNKILTCGGGGLIVSKNQSLIEKVRYLSTQAKDNPSFYIHNEIGFNYRMTNLQAAVALAQLENLDTILFKKLNVTNTYYDEFKKSLHLSFLMPPSFSNSNNWLNAIIVKNKATRDELLSKLKDANVDCRPLWHLNHLQLPYKNCQSYQISLAKKKLERILCIPSSANLTKQKIRTICKILNA